MNPRGVTLVELLVAISIILVVSALSLPAIYGRLGEARIESAKELIDSASVAARAESVRRARVVELVARHGMEGTELLIRVVDSSTAADDQVGSPLSSRREVSRGPVSQTSGQNKGRLWGILPAGMRVEATSISRDTAEAATGPDAVPVAVFLPDGMARGSGRSILTDGVQRLSISISGWAGGVAFSPVVSEEQPADERPSYGVRGGGGGAE